MLTQHKAIKPKQRYQNHATRASKNKAMGVRCKGQTQQCNIHVAQGLASKQHCKPRRLSRYWGIKVLAFLIGLCYLLFLIERQMRPILNGIIDYECKEYASIVFQQAVSAHLNQNPQAYQDLYDITRDANEVPTSVVANSYALNKAKNELAQQVIERLDVQDYQTENQRFRFGKLSGIQALSGVGPYISLQLEPQNYVVAKIYDTLETAGENQTKLNVYAEFTIHINVMMAGYTRTVEVKNEVLLWQNLIVGKVPDVNL